MADTNLPKNLIIYISWHLFKQTGEETEIIKFAKGAMPKYKFIKELGLDEI